MSTDHDPAPRPPRDYSVAGPWLAGGLVVVVLVGAFWWASGLQSTWAEQQAEPPPGWAATASATPSPEQSEPSDAVETPDPEPASVAVLGDSWVAGTDEGGRGPAGWPRLLADDLEVDVEVFATEGSGYLAGDESGATFAGQVERLDDSDWDGELVIVMGGREDVEFGSGDVESAAVEMLGDLAASQPQASILVVSPVWPAQEPPQDLIAGFPDRLVDAVRRATDTAGVEFASTQAPPWFTDDNADLLGPGGEYPTDAGHGLIATRIAGLVEGRLAQTAAAG